MPLPAAISHHSFLKSFHAIEFDDAGKPIPVGDDLVDRVVADSLSTGLPAIRQSSGKSDDVAMAIPVYRTEEVVSYAVFVGNSADERVGVFEVWQPIGDYDELSLTLGFFGTLERFQNVSSFVRFEKGSGLPGQIWRDRCAIVHDNLPSHAGFLRAAGASAGQLQVAFGIPVASEKFLASALLISSDAAPLSRSYEVWKKTADNFVLQTYAYQRLESSVTMESGSTLPLKDSLPGLALESGVVSVTGDQDLLLAGRGVDAPQSSPRLSSGIAIPFYESDQLTYVLTLLL